MSLLLTYPSSSSGIPGPDSVSGLRLWLKANTLVLNNNDPVALWTDSSGLGNNATQGTGINQPTFKTGIINGLPIVRFTGVGTNVHMQLPDFCSGFTVGEALIVCRYTAVDNNGLWYFGTDVSTNHVPFTDGNIYDGWGSTARKACGADPVAINVFMLYDVSSATGAWTARVNNSVLFTTGTNTVGFSTTSTIGGNLLGALPYAGDIAEVAMYNKALSAGERTTLTTYFNAKYAQGF